MSGHSGRFAIAFGHLHNGLISTIGPYNEGARWWAAGRPHARGGRYAVAARPEWRRFRKSHFLCTPMGRPTLPRRGFFYMFFRGPRSAIYGGPDPKGPARPTGLGGATSRTRGG